MADKVRWGILGTARITETAFLPGLRGTNSGVADAVAGRDPARTRRYAAKNGIERSLGSYAALLDDPRIDAVYIPLPNSVHAEWAIAALQSGKPVLCEKPLTTSAEETERVLQVARETGTLLWEAFVFLFRDQTDHVLRLLEGDVIGDLREIHATFHYPLPGRDNIRLDPHIGGGVLFDAGCYPIRLSRLLFNSEPVSGSALIDWAPEGVDENAYGVLTFPGERHLLFSCGMFRRYNTPARLLGSRGEIRLTRGFHPTSVDTIEIVRDDGIEVEHATRDEASFTPALNHIHAVFRSEEQPRHLALDEALGNAWAIDLLYRSARSGRVEASQLDVACSRAE
jgi:predicted dehydrogenase